MIKVKKIRELKPINGNQKLPCKKKADKTINAARNERIKSGKSEKRTFVEYVIRLIKIFGVVRERFRLRDNNYQKVILTIYGLVRLIIGNVYIAILVFVAKILLLFRKQEKVNREWVRVLKVLFTF